MDSRAYSASLYPGNLSGAPTRDRWLSRALAILGFVLLFAVMLGCVSRQLAIERAQSYVRSQYHLDLELDVTGIQAVLVTPAAGSTRRLPPLGLCWVAQVAAGPVRAELTLNPWTGEVIEGGPVRE